MITASALFWPAVFFMPAMLTQGCSVSRLGDNNNNRSRKNLKLRC